MDHERVNISQSSMSCGVMELSRISDDLEDVVFAIATRLYHPARGNPCACFVWSNLNKNDALAQFVRNERFGIITRIGPTENPRTGNMIYIYTWEIKHDAFKAWYITRRIERLKKAGT